MAQELSKEYKLKLANYILETIFELYLKQEKVACKAESDVEAERNFQARKSQFEDDNYGGGAGFGQPGSEIIKSLEDYARRERTEANSRKDAYQLLLSKILHEYTT